MSCAQSTLNTAPCLPVSRDGTTAVFRIVIVVWVVAGLVSYRQVGLELIEHWRVNPSYSHGMLVPPIAVWLLWHRRSLLPAAGAAWWPAAVMLLVAHVTLWAAAQWHVPAVARWSWPLWLVGWVGWVWGRDMLKWSLPGLGFLTFMIPVPFQVEQLASQWLQWSSAWISCLALAWLSLPATTDGTALVMPAGRVEISTACSGLRMTVAMLAVTYLLACIQPRVRQRMAILLPSLIPCAVLANALRITSLAWVVHSFRLPGLAEWVHDVGDWAVLPVLAGLLVAVSRCLAWLVDRGAPVVSDTAGTGGQMPGGVNGPPGVRRRGLRRIGLAALWLVVPATASVANYAYRYHDQQSQWRAEVDAALASGDVAAARAALQQWLEFEPDSVDLRFQHAELAARLADDVASRQDVLLQYASVLERAPFHQPALLAHLELALELGLPQAAMASATALEHLRAAAADSSILRLEAHMRFADPAYALQPDQQCVWERALEDVLSGAPQRDRWVLEAAGFASRWVDRLDAELLSKLHRATADVVHRGDTALAHLQLWRLEQAMGLEGTGLQLACERLQPAACTEEVAYQVRMAAARQAQQEGRADAAEPWLQAAALSPVDDGSAWRALGELHYVCQQWEPAAAAYSRAADCASGLPLSEQVHWAVCRWRGQQQADVRRLAAGLNRRVGEYPEELRLPVAAWFEWQLIRAEMIEAQGAWAQALLVADLTLDYAEMENAANQRVPTVDGQSVPALLCQLKGRCLVRLKRYEAAARHFERQAQQAAAAPEAVDQRTAAARAWHLAGETLEAQRCYRRAVLQAGGLSTVWLEYVAYLQATSGVEAAAGEVAYRQSQASFDDAVHQIALAQAWEGLENSPRAAACYALAAKLEPQHRAAHVIHLSRCGQVARAVELLLAPEWDVPVAVRGHAAAMVGMTAVRLSEAQEQSIQDLVQHALVQEPTDVPLLLAAAEWFSKMEEAHRAVEMLTRVLDLEAGHPVAANNLAMLLADHASDPQQALHYINLALSKTGPVAEFLDTKGWILLQMNQPEQALQWLAEAVAASPPNPLIHLHLAATYLALGDAESARQHWLAASQGELRHDALSARERAAWNQLQTRLDLHQGEV